MVVNKSSFGKADNSSLTQGVKDKALPFLIFMVMKYSSELKTRGCSNSNPQCNNMINLVLLN